MTTNSTWAALRNPTFRKLWIAAVISGTCVAAHDSAATWMMNLITIIVVQRWYWCTGIQARVYSESLLTLILALATVAVTAALADDASMKKQFVGYWNNPRQQCLASHGGWYNAPDTRTFDSMDLGRA